MAILTKAHGAHAAPLVVNPESGEGCGKGSWVLAGGVTALSKPLLLSALDSSGSMCLSVGQTQIDADADIMPQNKQCSVWPAFVPTDSVLHMLMTTLMVKKTYSMCFFFSCSSFPWCHKCHVRQQCWRPVAFCVACHLSWVGNNTAETQTEGIAQSWAFLFLYSLF